MVGGVELKNPMIKRIPRELKSDFGKYIVIFLFMTLTIGFISGFLVAGGSMKTAYERSFDKYNIEWGNFSSEKKISKDVISKIEKPDVKLYENFYKDTPAKTRENGKKYKTVRIFKNRTDVNKICLMKGKMPKEDNEIGLDRMFADNNDLSVGDYITIENKKMKITGLVAFSDYSALFSNNTDLMFDAVLFSVAVVNDNTFYSISANETYSYSWMYNDAPSNDTKEKKKSDKFMEKLATELAMSGNELKTYIPRYENSAINFTGDDIGSDRSMMIILLYILITILAFVFAVTINHTIQKESTVIGTLRAMGYSKIHLICHYLTITVIISLIAAIIGNILGYTLFKNVVASMYYGSYSLPTYKTLWDLNAFILTTIVPLIIMIVINTITLQNKLKLSPLKFIRKDLKKNKNSKALKLPNFKILTRFRLRVVLQNKGSYITLFIGIVFANILLMFGMMMKPLLTHYQDEIVNNMIAKYQYVLKTPVKVKDSEAEKYSMSALEINRKSLQEEVSVYGITNNSKYVKFHVDDGYYISNSLAEKYGLSEGEVITLKEKYSSKKYKFIIKGIVDYPSGIAVFTSIKNCNRIFDYDLDYFTGYFSNRKLNIDKENVLSIITKTDLTKTSRQLNVSMGEMFNLINAFAIVLFLILMYLLTKLIIERNTSSISMTKILGYTTKEIGKIYLIPTSCIVVISILISMFISEKIIKIIYFEMMKDYSGWLTLYIAPKVYIGMFIIGVISYLFVALLQVRKINKIPMDEALKNVE